MPGLTLCKKCPEAYILQFFEGTRNNYDQKTRIAKRRITVRTFPASLANAFSPKEPLKAPAFAVFFRRLRIEYLSKFTEETGIPVTTFSQGQGDDWLFPLIRAVRGGLAPMDVTILDEVADKANGHGRHRFVVDLDND